MLRKIPVENFAPLQQNRELTNVQVQIQCESQATRKWLEQNGRLRNMLVQSSVDPTPFELTNGKPLVILSLCGWRGDAAWQFVRQHDDCRSHCNDDDGIFCYEIWALVENISTMAPPNGHCGFLFKQYMCMYAESTHHHVWILYFGSFRENSATTRTAQVVMIRKLVGSSKDKKFPLIQTNAVFEWIPSNQLYTNTGDNQVAMIVIIIWMLPKRLWPR